MDKEYWDELDIPERFIKGDPDPMPWIWAFIFFVIGLIWYFH